MAHFSTTLEMRKSTSYEWLPVGATIGKLVNAWSFREDLVVNLGEETSAPAPALFNPATAEIEINTRVAFDCALPEEIGDLSKRKTQLEYAKGAGAIFHEALHARFTRFSLADAVRDLSPKALEALHNLEEGRIEAFGVRTSPDKQILLRSCAMGIVLSDLENQLDSITNVFGAGKLAALTLARVDAGVLKASDVEPVVPILEGILGVEVLDELRKIWIEFQAHNLHNDATKLYVLANQWVEILEKVRKEKGEDEGDGSGEGVCGHPSPSGKSGEKKSGKGKSGKDKSDEDGASGEDGEDSEDEEEGENPVEVLRKIVEKALEEIKDNVEIDTRGELDSEITKEEWKEEAENRANESKNAKDNRKVAHEVFSKTTGPSTGDKTFSRLKHKRPPTSDERIASVKIAQALERAKYRERDVVEINTPEPGGKLRTRAVVQGAALKAKGIHTPVDAWQRTVRRHTEEPTLTIGVMVDISGSMGGAMEPMATTAWVLSEAGRRVQARTAMVYYGNSVFPTLKPGQYLDEVQVYSASDGTEEAVDAFKAIDGSLNLLHGSGARMLVVVSDGIYFGEEMRNGVSKFVRDCQQNGVAVVWLDFSNGMYSRRYLDGTDGEQVLVDAKMSASEVATIIGNSAVKALEKVGKRNA